MRFLFLLSLISTIATAQVAGVCAAGRPCSVSSLRATTGPFACSVSMPVTGYACLTTAANGPRIYASNTTNTIYAAGTHQFYNQTLGDWGGVTTGSFTSAYTVTANQGFAAPVAFSSFPICNATTNGRLLYDGTNTRWRTCDGTTTGSGWIPTASTPSDAQRLYVLDPQNTPAWLSSVPRSGGAAVTVAVVDSAAATGDLVAMTNGSLGPARGMNTTAVIGGLSSLFVPTWANHVVGRGRACWRAQLNATTTVRHWAGFMSALPGASDSPAIDHVSFRYSTNVPDVGWQACYGTGGTTCTSTGVAPDTSSHVFCVDCAESNFGAGTYACSWTIDGTLRARVTSGIPSGSILGYGASVETRAASARSLSLGTVSIQSNF